MKQITENEFLTNCILHTVYIGKSTINEGMIYTPTRKLGYIPLNREQANKEYLAILRRNGYRCKIKEVEYEVTEG
jgi:hypothetical protein